MSHPSRTHSSSIGRARWWVILLVTIPVLLAIQELAWVLFAPWAVSWLPGPKLIGTYAGVLEAEQGARYPVLLDLEPNIQRRTGPGNPRASNLQGRAQLCTPHGMRFAYDVRGRGSPMGDEVELWLEYPDPQLSQLNLRLTGAWHGDRLALQPARSNPFAPDGRFIPNRPMSSADPDDYFRPIELRKDAVETLAQECGRPPEH